MCHVTKIHEHNDEFSILQWPPQSPDAVTCIHVEHFGMWKIHGMNGQLKNLLN